jgi:thiamine biosynthesis protein ThiS
MSGTTPNAPEAPITIQVNGERRATPEGTTIVLLLNQLGLNAARVAIEYNLKILPKTKWPDTRVAPGDCLEIVQFVGGG